MGYSVWMLEKGNITVSDGASLDGITQGDGSHLVGRSITLDSNDWLETRVRDNDGFFDDNDNDQHLDGHQQIDGANYTPGTKVEAEYRLTLQDPSTGETWDVLGYNVNNSSPAYGTVEGLAFVGPSGGFPPVGVPLTVTQASEGPNFSGQPRVAADDLVSPACFVAGTLIETPDGPLAVERLRAGDRVVTADHGPQTVRWAGSVHVSPQRLARAPAFHPVLIRAHALGPGRPRRDLRVSQQHRILIDDWRAELMFGTASVLAPAAHLIDGRGIDIDRRGAAVCYVHICFDRHEIVDAEGLAAESLRPGPQALASLPAPARAELLALFPRLVAIPDVPAAAARPMLRRPEARVLARRKPAGATAPA